MNPNSLRTIHVVDDDEAVRRSLAALLVSRGYGVMPFASGEQFLAEADLSRHGCVVLDLRMDGLSGLQVLQALRARGSPLGVLFLSGHGDLPSAVAFALTSLETNRVSVPASVGFAAASKSCPHREHSRPPAWPVVLTETSVRQVLHHIRD